ncbi:MAG TPA: hypothetical protein VEA37_04965, partial [Flavobacterium sp.]|nr:hypothetical protein [Flavobacterium sp.]
YCPTGDNEHLLTDLGKYKIGKACIYVKKLSDINISALERLCRDSMSIVKEKYEIVEHTNRKK